MVFNPKDKSKVVCNNFPCFSVDGKPLQFVTEFKHIGLEIGSKILGFVGFWGYLFVVHF